MQRCSSSSLYKRKVHLNERFSKQEALSITCSDHCLTSENFQMAKSSPLARCRAHTGRLCGQLWKSTRGNQQWNDKEYRAPSCDEHKHCTVMVKRGDCKFFICEDEWISSKMTV